jgi:undecaprenyl-diphosphatase
LLAQQNEGSAMKLINAIHKYDIFMFNWLNNVSIHAFLVRLCRYISKTADGLLYLILGVWLFWDRGIHDSLLQTLILAFIIERPLYFVIKNGFKRNRPQEVLKNFRSVITPSDQFSFPSGHTSAACMMATVLAYFFPGFLVGLYIWVALVGFSRVVLGVHFPTDTVMGAVLGFGSGIFSLDYILL